MKNERKYGFTLVELLAVIAILAILVVIAMPNVLKMFEDSKKNVFATEVKSILKSANTKYLDSMGSEKKFCKSKTDQLELLDIDSSGIYYYIMKDNSGKTIKAIVWNDKGFLTGDAGDVTVQKIDGQKVISVDTSSFTCENIIDKYNSAISSSSIELPEIPEEGSTLDPTPAPVISLSNYKFDVNNFFVGSIEVSVHKIGGDASLDFVEYLFYEKTDAGYVFIESKVSRDSSRNFFLEYRFSDSNVDLQNYAVRAKLNGNDEYMFPYQDVQQYLCFVAGTKVKTENGFKNIEDITIGEKVYSYNLDTNEVELKDVINIIRSYTWETYKMTINGKVVEMSPKHQIYIVDKGWVRAYDVKEGDLMLSIDGKKVPITNIEYKKHDSIANTYNLTVDGNSNFFVTDIQVLVHNTPSVVK